MAELIGTATFGAEDNWKDAAWQTAHKGDGNAVQNYTQQYTYDAVGNILVLRHIADAGAYTRTYDIATDNNRLLSTYVDPATYSYSYDVRGNMCEMPHLDAMHWNLNNELHKIENGTMEAYYQYSGGQRIRKYVDKGSIKEERIYLGSFEIYRKFEGGSLTQSTGSVPKVERTTVHINDDTGRIAMLEKRTFGSAADDNGTAESLERYVYSNHLQSASLELDEDGAIISYEEYHPYGTTSYQANNSDIKATAKRYKYTGKERDEESGLYYHGARYYVPWLGRWCAVDPINSDNYNLAQGYGLEKNKERDYTELAASPYEYCYDNPINYNDPTGEQPPNLQPTINLGVSFGSDGFKANVNVTLDQKVGDWTGSYGLGVTYHENFYTTGKGGFEVRNSFMINYDDGKLGEIRGTGFSLGTNIWSGFGEMKEFTQRTGILAFRSGDFYFSYENDGTPFQWLGLGDGGDSYRTAAASVGIGDFSLNMNLVTGLRNKVSYFVEDNLLAGGTKGNPQGRGEFGENYKHGFVYEQDTKYRFGGLALNYGGLSVGVNSEWVRHTFQNVIAHDIIQPQRQFPMLNNAWKPVYNYSNQGRTSKFTTWGR